MATKFDNSGTLFKNEDKDKDGANPNWPDLKGNITINGQEYWLNAWFKTSDKTGNKFISLSVKQKEKGSKPRPKQANAIKDDLPW
jgi:hypothetical protein